MCGCSQGLWTKGLPSIQKVVKQLLHSLQHSHLWANLSFLKLLTLTTNLHIAITYDLQCWAFINWLGHYFHPGVVQPGMVLCQMPLALCEGNNKYRIVPSFHILSVVKDVYFSSTKRHNGFCSCLAQIIKSVSVLSIPNIINTRQYRLQMCNLLKLL